VGFLVGGVILGAFGIVLANLVTAPPGASLPERIAYGVVGFLAALGVAVLAAYGWAFIHAPYEQRNALRVIATQLRADASAQETRRKRLLNDRVLTNETFYIWELLKPGERPLIQHREFIDCTIKGPAIISPQLSVDFDDMTLGLGSIDSVIYDLVPGQRQGLIALIHCKFKRGSMDGIGFYVDKDLRAKLEGIHVI